MEKKIEKIKKIKILLTDVDGVLTDGGLYYTKDGDFMKRFFVKDGMGAKLLQIFNIKTIIVTKEKSPITRKWFKNMPIAKIYDGINDKLSILKKITKLYNVSVSEIAYIGDDINDIELLKKVGFSCCPNDAIEEVKMNVDYICKCDGGKGSFREVADLILQNYDLKSKLKTYYKNIRN